MRNNTSTCVLFTLVAVLSTRRHPAHTQSPCRFFLLERYGYVTGLYQSQNHDTAETHLHCNEEPDGVSPHLMVSRAVGASEEIPRTLARRVGSCNKVVLPLLV